MLLATLSLATLSTLVPLAGEHGDVAWFQGTPQAALARAKSEGKFVFIDFWTDWCTYCKKLDREAFVDPDVVAALESLVAINVDAESEQGAALAKRFGVSSYPALILLNPQGVAEDNIGGYLAPDRFLAEIRRVQRGEGTVSALRATVNKNPGDLDTRYELALKLRSVGDSSAAEAQLSAIEKADPEAKSDAMKRLLTDRARTRLREVVAELMSNYEEHLELDPTPMETFLKQTKVAAVRFEGWLTLGNMHGQIGELAQGRAAHRRAWGDCPDEHKASFGNQLAWNFYEYEDELSDDDKAFALRVALAAAEAAGDDADVLDTLACCYAMNGKREEAIATIKRAIELEPHDADWAERLESLQQDE